MHPGTNATHPGTNAMNKAKQPREGKGAEKDIMHGGLSGGSVIERWQADPKLLYGEQVNCAFLVDFWKCVTGTDRTAWSP